MGNMCGRIEDPDPFSHQGRVLGSAPAGPKTAAVPDSRRQKQQHKVGGPPRTLGGAGDSSDPGDARRKAAEAAEARSKSSPKGGKLQAQLSAQKKQSRMDALAEASNNETRARDADQAAKTRNWD